MPKGFRVIPGFERYRINREGLVLNDRGGVIKPWKHESRKGCFYMRVSLFNKGVRKNMRIHRAVAMAFISNPENLPEVNHIDGDTFNNHASNLEWVDGPENKRFRG